MVALKVCLLTFLTDNLIIIWMPFTARESQALNLMISVVISFQVRTALFTVLVIVPPTELWR